MALLPRRRRCLMLLLVLQCTEAKPSWRKDVKHEFSVAEMQEEAQIYRDSKREKASLTLGKKGRGPKQPTVLDENNKVVLVDSYAHAQYRQLNPHRPLFVRKSRGYAGTPKFSGWLGLEAGELPEASCAGCFEHRLLKPWPSSVALHSLPRVVLRSSQQTLTIADDGGAHPVDDYGAGL
jgi:hypothetical protein